MDSSFSTLLYCCAVRTRAQMRVRIVELERTLDGLRVWRDAFPEGAPQRVVAARSMETVKTHLDHAKRAIALIQDSISAYEDSYSPSPEQFAMEWLIQHGIHRGMPHGWDHRID